MALAESDLSKGLRLKIINFLDRVLNNGRPAVQTNAAFALRVLAASNIPPSFKEAMVDPCISFYRQGSAPLSIKCDILHRLARSHISEGQKAKIVDCIIRNDRFRDLIIFSYSDIDPALRLKCVNALLRTRDSVIMLVYLGFYKQILAVKQKILREINK